MEKYPSPDSSSGSAEVLAQVRQMIGEIIGQTVDLNDREISMETSFSKDLELESIEFVVLSEKLQSKYGKNIDFSIWLAGKELDEIINLRVKDVVGFISECRC